MFKILEGGIEPTKETKYSAGIDLYAREDIVIGAGETVKVPLGVCIDLNKYFEHNFHCSQSSGLLYDIDMEIRSIQEYAYDDPLNKVLYNKQVSDLVRERELAKTNFLNSHYLELHPASELRAKGLVIGVEIINLDYKDELTLTVHNPLRSRNRIDSHNNVWSDKVAQILLKEHKSYLFNVENN